MPVRRIASQIVEECTLIDTCKEVQETDDKVYNYAQVLCHYSALVAEFIGGWGDGCGDRMFRCELIVLVLTRGLVRVKGSLMHVKAWARPYARARKYTEKID